MRGRQVLPNRTFAAAGGRPLSARIGCAALLAMLFMAIASASAATVQLELVGDTRGSALAFQDWARRLGEAGIPNVRIRQAVDADKIGIQIEGDPGNPRYVVTGMVRSSDELFLPGRRFRRNEIGAIRQWLDDLARHGPPDARPEKTLFGLTAAELERVKRELSAPVGFSTANQNARQIVERINAQLPRPLRLDPELRAALDAKKIEEELNSLARGTALAYVLHGSGHGLLPQADQGLSIEKVRPDEEVWPVGWPPPSGQKGPPALFEFLNVNVQNVSAATAIAAIAERMKMPVLFDRASLQRHGIDPAQKMVSLPRSRTTYSLALRKLLFQAGMKFEVCRDDAGEPLLWITSVKPGGASPSP